MKKKNIIIISIVAIILIISTLLILNPFKSNSPHKVTITQYKIGKNEVIKTITIDKESDIEELEKYIKDLKPLEPHEYVDLALAQQIVIQYDDNIEIGIQLEMKGYCYYINKDENISSLSHMPKGLYNWIKDKIK
jgi:Cft2 family RNA processing exonuclease